MNPVEQENIVFILRNGRKDNKVKFSNAFSPKEFKTFCKQQGWRFRSEGDSVAYGQLQNGKHAASHFVNSGNTFIYS